MNLWAKRAGLLLSAAVLFFLISCEDDSFLLGFRGKKKFQGQYHEIVFNGDKSSVLVLDSVYTDNQPLSVQGIQATYRYLIGQYNDPELGPVRAEVFAQFQPDNDPSKLPFFNTKNETIILDSISVSLRFDYYIYGSLGNISERVNVHRLTDSLSYSKRYFNSSTLPYDPVPLGQMSFDLERIIYDLADDSGRDSSFYLRGTLGTKFIEGAGPGWDYAQELLAYARSKGDSALVRQNVKEFRRKFFGLAFIPATTDGIFGYSPLYTNSKLTLHYQTLTEDSLALSFYFTPYGNVIANAATNITTSRMGDLSGIPSGNIPYNPADDSKRYIQDGSTVITELDLADFYSFADTLENIIINSAELTADVLGSPAGINPPSSLYPVLMKKQAGRIVPLSMKNDHDSLTWRQFGRVLYTDTTNFAIATELSNQTPLVLSYSRSSKKYSGYATMFFQQLFDNKDNAEFKIEHIGLYPATAPIYRRVRYSVNPIPAVITGIGNEVNRATLKTSGIKLKLYYTKIN